MISAVVQEFLLAQAHPGGQQTAFPTIGTHRMSSTCTQEQHMIRPLGLTNRRRNSNATRSYATEPQSYRDEPVIDHQSSTVDSDIAYQRHPGAEPS